MNRRQIFVLFFGFIHTVLHAQVVNVSTNTQLQSALTNAQPGQTIIMADGLYHSASGNFTVPAGVNGIPSQPITLKGTRNAILTTADSAHGYGLWLTGNKYWVLKGFTTRYSKNGIVIDSSQYITIDSVLAKKTGQEAIHLRTYTSYCMVKNCFIDSTGLLIPGEGEGIYIGSAVSNWCTYTMCNADTSNYDTAFNNSFGSAVSAENIDIKEGTISGLITGNHFNGAGLSNQNGADSWIDVKGNFYRVENNDGIHTILDGFQTHIQTAGYGNFNTFNSNILTVNAPGYGVRIQTSNSNGTAANNTVCNNNVVSGATSGTANVATQSCLVVLASELISWNAQKQQHGIIFTWQLGDAGIYQQFGIEQSEDGNTFSMLKIVPVAGKNYVISIPGTMVHGNYFRLILYKNSGLLTYSSIIHLASPSPVITLHRSGNSLVVINLSDNAYIRIFSTEGKLICTFETRHGFNFFPFPYPHAIYFVENQVFPGQLIVF